MRWRSLVERVKLFLYTFYEGPRFWILSIAVVGAVAYLVFQIIKSAKEESWWAVVCFLPIVLLAVALAGLVRGGDWPMGDVKNDAVRARCKAGLHTKAIYDDYPGPATPLDATVLSNARTLAHDILEKHCGLPVEVITPKLERMRAALEPRVVEKTEDKKRNVQGCMRLAEADQTSAVKICLYSDNFYKKFAQCELTSDESREVFVALVLVHELMHLCEACGGFFEAAVEGDASDLNRRHVGLIEWLGIVSIAVSSAFGDDEERARGACAIHWMTDELLGPDGPFNGELQRLTKKKTQQSEFGPSSWGLLAYSVLKAEFDKCPNCHGRQRKPPREVTLGR